MQLERPKVSETNSSNDFSSQSFSAESIILKTYLYRHVHYQIRCHWKCTHVDPFGRFDVEKSTEGMDWNGRLHGFSPIDIKKNE